MNERAIDSKWENAFAISVTNWKLSTFPNSNFIKFDIGKESSIFSIFVVFVVIVEESCLNRNETIKSIKGEKYLQMQMKMPNREK